MLFIVIIFWNLKQTWRKKKGGYLSYKTWERWVYSANTFERSVSMVVLTFLPVKSFKIMFCFMKILWSVMGNLLPKFYSVWFWLLWNIFWRKLEKEVRSHSNLSIIIFSFGFGGRKWRQHQDEEDDTSLWAVSQTMILMLLCIIEHSLFLTEAILVTFSVNSLIFIFFHSFSHSFTLPPNFNYRIYLLNSAKTC